MKNYMKIILFGLLVLQTTIYSLNAQVVVNSNNIYGYEQMNKTLTSNTVSAYDLEGFEMRGKQKIKDFINYLEIISDNSYDLSLREHAYNLTKQLFANKDQKINDIDVKTQKIAELNIDDYLNLFMNNEYSKIKFDITNITNKHKLINCDSQTYRGAFFVACSIEYYNGDKVAIKMASKKEVEIILMKRQKQFGNEKKDVWEVLLGYIK